MRTSKRLKLLTSYALSILVFTSVFTSGSLLAAQMSLVPFHAVYTAFKWDDDIGSAELKLEALGAQQYALTYSSKVSKFFLSDKRFEHSIFHVEDGQLVPEEYHYTRSGTGPNKALSLTFKSGLPAMISSSEGQPMPWQGELDNQLYRIDLPLKLAAGETDFDYQLINYRGERKAYHMSVIATEELTLPFGKLEAIKVKIIRTSNKRETFVWFAPTLNYQLVRLQQYKDGEEQGDIQLRTYTRL
jgi:hypothetical protein